MATGETEAVEATRPEPTEAAAKIEVAVKVEVKDTAPSPKLKQAKCVTVISVTETKLGTV